MSRVVYYAAATLDGFIAESDDTLEWLMKYEGSYEGDDAEPMKGSYDVFYEGIGALVMGSTTYEFVLDEVSEWPYAGKPSWILSSRDLPLPEGEGEDGVKVVRRRCGRNPRRGRAAGGRPRHLGGRRRERRVAVRRTRGCSTRSLVTVVPVVLGEGKPLFDRRVPGGPMQLVGTRTWDTGMVELRYEIRR